MASVSVIRWFQTVVISFTRSSSSISWDIISNYFMAFPWNTFFIYILQVWIAHLLANNLLNNTVKCWTKTYIDRHQVRFSGSLAILMQVAKWRYLNDLLFVHVHNTQCTCTSIYDDREEVYCHKKAVKFIVVLLLNVCGLSQC